MKGGSSEYWVSMSKLRTSPAVTPRACLHPLSVVQYSIDLCSRSDFCTLVFYFAVYVLFIARRRFSWCLKHVQRRRLSQLCCHTSYFHIVIFFIDFHIYCKCPIVQCLLFVLVLFNVCIVNCIILLFSGEVVWFRFLPYYRREGFPEVYRGHPRLPGARGAAEQGLQPVPGHVEHRGHHLRLPVRNIPLQRGRGHPRADPERILHVSSSSMEGDIQGCHRAHHQSTAGMQKMTYSTF